MATAVRDKAAGTFEFGDVILTVGDREIVTQNDLLRALRRDVTNRKVAVVVRRADQDAFIEWLPRSVRTFA